MKRIASLAGLMLALSAPAFAQVTAAPPLMNFQGRLAKPDGTPVADGNHSVVFSFYTAPMGGSLLWTETDLITSRNGAFATLLGTHTALTDAIFASNVWLQIKVDGAAPLTPLQQIVSSAFAFKANTVPDGSITNIKIAAGTITPDKIAGGTALTLPFAATVNTASNVFSVTNTGTGYAGYFKGGGFDGLYAETTYSSGNGIVGVANTGASAYGVEGLAAQGYGGYFSGATGAKGVSSAGDGLYGSSSSSHGVYGISSAGIGGYFTSGGLDGVYGESTQSSGNGVLGVANTGVAAYGVEGDAAEGYGGHFSGGRYGAYAYSSAGTGLYAGTSTGTAGYFNGAVTINGIATAHKVQIVGGSDVAEPYRIAAGGGIAPKAGMVVTIDPNRIGQMRVANKAYDRTVSGIISGANGIEPGITLTQKGTVADGSLPVASMGRVWAMCDAGAGGAIRAGDLLTTSATPGHAMKAKNGNRASGAILGKAMSSLAQGRGLVLVLVTLQ